MKIKLEFCDICKKTRVDDTENDKCFLCEKLVCNTCRVFVKHILGGKFILKYTGVCKRCGSRINKTLIDEKLLKDVKTLIHNHLKKKFKKDFK